MDPKKLHEAEVAAEAIRRFVPWEKGGTAESGRIKNHPLGEEIEAPSGAIRRFVPWEKGATAEGSRIKNHPLTTDDE